MGAAVLPLLASGIGAGASLIGDGKNQAAQNNATNAAQGYYNAEAGGIKQLLSQYFQNAPMVIDDLQNFSAHQQPEIQHLANMLGLGNQSLLGSMRDNVSGAANPGELLGVMGQRLMQNQMETTQGMESNLAGQQLSAYEDLGSFLGQPLSASLGGLNSIGNSYMNAARGMGNPYGNLGTALGGFLGQLGSFGGFNNGTPGSGSPTPSSSGSGAFSTAPNAYSGGPWNAGETGVTNNPYSGAVS